MLKKVLGKIIRIEIGLTAALVGLIGISALAQNSGTTGQIVPGATGSITPTQGVTPTAVKPPPHLMDDALSPQTRQTLQEAMNSVEAPVVTMPVGPGEAVELDGTTISKVSFDNLPAAVKNALGTEPHGVLSSGAGG